MSTTASATAHVGMPVDMQVVTRRLMVLEHYADLLKVEIDLLHQLLPALQTPCLPSQSQSPFGSESQSPAPTPVMTDRTRDVINSAFQVNSDRTA